MPDDSPQPPAEDKDLAQAGADLLRPVRGKNSIPRVVSLIVLIGVLVFIALLFFRVMALFIVPLFLAGVLVVVFEPVFKWFDRKLPGRTALASLCTTVVILLSVLIPTGLLGWSAYVELKQIIAPEEQRLPSPAEVARALRQNPDALPQPLKEKPNVWEFDFDNLEEGSALDRVAGLYETLFHRNLNNSEVDKLRDQLILAISDDGVHSVIGGLKAIGAFLLGLVVMTVAVFYFFADGPAMVKTLMHLSPLDDEYEVQLLERFSEVSRAVVVATVLSAIVQGLLAGVGYWLAVTLTGVEGWPVFLLTLMTIVMAMVPFVGAMSIWAIVAIGLFLQGETTAAIALAIYGAAIVSTADNVIKPIVLHGQSNLHPLLALLSVLGGVTVLGPIGILVGPMLVAFLQALLTMLRKELDQFDEAPGDAALATPGIPSTTNAPERANASTKKSGKRRGKRRN